jgi:hypothetical protein
MQSTVVAANVNANAVAVVATSLATAQKKTDDVGAACDAGRYGVMVGNFKVCALCASGTISDDGYGCTACDAGTAAAAVGASTCINCVAGSYAQGGEWAGACMQFWCPEISCLLMPAGLGCLDCSGSKAHPPPPLPAPFIHAGNSDCLPCLPGTFSNAAAASECTEW